MTNQKPDTSWRKEYLELKAGLSKRQIQLLEDGPHSLSQSWILGALHNDYKKMKGIKDTTEENKGQLQSSLKDFFKKTG